MAGAKKQKALRLKGFQKKQGFSLIELMIVVALVAGVAATAAPALAPALLRLEQRSIMASLLADLTLARSESIKRGARVTVCVAASPVACSATGTWADGWLVFVDQNQNGVLDSGEPLVRQREALNPGWSFTGNTPVARYVSYVPTGSLRQVSGAIQAGTIRLCRPSMDLGRVSQLVVSSSGRPRIQAAVGGCV